jgi:hypothetical protein
VVFTQAQRGADSVAVFLRGLLRGLHSFAVFCVVYSVLLTASWPWWAAAPAALAAQVSLQWVLLRRRRT